MKINHRRGLERGTNTVRDDFACPRGSHKAMLSSPGNPLTLPAEGSAVSSIHLQELRIELEPPPAANLTSYGSQRREGVLAGGCSRAWLAVRARDGLDELVEL